jgi:hypothetical protein
MTMQDFWGLSGSAALLTAAIFSLPPLNTRQGAKRRLAAAALFSLIMLPFMNGLAVAGYLRGITGDLSVTTVMLLLLFISGGNRVADNSRKALLILVLIEALVLYPLSVGPFPLDPYEWGYQPRGLLIAIAGAGFLSSRKYPAVTLLLLLTLLAYAAKIGESVNLWDYLLDPLVLCYAIGALLLKPFYRRL